MKLLNIFYYSYLIYIIYNSFNKNLFKYVNSNEWIKISINKQLYVFDNHNYCIKTNSNLIFNYFICCQNIEIHKNKFNITNEQNDSNSLNNDALPINNYVKEIIYINTFNQKNIFEIIGYSLVIIYLILLCVLKFYHFIINFISILINEILKIFNNESNKNKLPIDNDFRNKITPIENNITLNSLFNNIFGEDSIFDVKKEKDESITIDNFIGCSNIKNEINKIINQIKHESIFKNNFCELPKGVLIIGPPGVGKTHLVKTIINSTGMNYIFISGSDFNKKYVGSGSSTVSKLFMKARENKPCLIFIDEADTILKKRSHSETSSASIDFNSTICKFLAEMDSLKTETGVIVIFASNMDIEHIDKGLTRAGRVDQIIHINHPTFEERIELFKMYLDDLYDDTLIDINKISKLSYGLTGSDIKKIINLIKINKVEEYIQISYNNKLANHNKVEDNNKEEENNREEENNKEYKNNKKDETKIKIVITTNDIDKEISKCNLGLERNRKVNELNKKIIAYHEAGHAILGFLIKDSIIPEKICISINSKSLGYTLFPQEDDDLLLKTTINQLLTEVMILYGGRISEKKFIGDITCGAEDDYSRARKIIKRLLMNGMLILENNFVDFENKENKLSDQMEIEIKNINIIIQQNIIKIFEEYKLIIKEIAEKIIEYGSIVSDDIYQIFENNNMKNCIGSYDIEEIREQIEESLIKKFDKFN